jgi:hypothetical protein
MNYKGTLKDFLPHGQGTYTYVNGDKYAGEWKKGKRHGQGTYTHADGDKYVGEWKKGNEHGQGTYTHADGDKYVGEWKEGNKHGQGTYSWPMDEKYNSEKIYVGEWKDDEMHGEGTETGILMDGSKLTYSGNWKNGKKHGEGTYICVQPENNILPKVEIKYVGEWRNDKRHGYGDSESADGKKYAGEWKNNSPHEGTHTFIDGSKYTGGFKGGQDFHGQGTRIYPNGNKYVGEWKKSKYHGQGTFIESFLSSTNNTKGRYKYVGEWKNGKKHGHGVETLVEENVCSYKYAGEWRSDKYHGRGTITTFGYTYTGEWRNNRAWGEGNLTLRLSDSEEVTFIGNFKGRKSKTINFKDTFIFDGMFETKKDGKTYMIEFDHGEIVYKKSELARKIAAGESKTVEFKQTFSLETKTKTKQKYLIDGKIETVAGFLNAEGGNLIIGVDDQGKILGVDEEIVLFYKDEDKFLRAVKDCMREEIGRAILASYVDFTIETESNKKLLVITCEKSTEPVYSADGSLLKVRIGPSNESLTGRECVQYVNEHFPPKEKDQQA